MAPTLVPCPACGRHVEELRAHVPELRRRTAAAGTAPSRAPRWPCSSASAPPRWGPSRAAAASGGGTTGTAGSATSAHHRLRRRIAGVRSRGADRAGRGRRRWYAGAGGAAGAARADGGAGGGGGAGGASGARAAREARAAARRRRTASRRPGPAAPAAAEGSALGGARRVRDPRIALFSQHFIRSGAGALLGISCLAETARGG